MGLSILFAILGLVGLYLGGDWLVKGATRLAESLGVSTLLIGLTVVAVGTSSPELLVSLSAAARGENEMALGNVIGSNIANIGLILGLTALVRPIVLQRVSVKRQLPLLVLVTLLVGFVAINGTIGRLEGLAMVAGYAALTAAAYVLARRSPAEAGAATKAEAAPTTPTVTADAPPWKRHPHADEPNTHRGKEFGRIALGVLFLVVGAQMLVQGATDIAVAIGISQFLISITLVALGTSLPELVTSVSSARKGESGLALGNVTGSNIANILLVLGLSALIDPIAVDPLVSRGSFIAMVLFALVLLPFARDYVFSKREGLFLVAAYWVLVVAAFVAFQ